MRNSRKLRKLRNKAAQRQRGRCHYCLEPMWDEDQRAFGERFALTFGQTLRYRCTAEHLLERCKGGADDERNIVAACHHCNRTRHRAKRPKDPASYSKYVQARMGEGRWHPDRLERQPDP